MADRMVVLRLDFVAKPDGTSGMARSVAGLLETAGLEDAGLMSGLLLVSDREARLVTLLTFWDAHQFLPARERRIEWMQKLVVPFADGAVRADTSVASVLAGAHGMAVPAGLGGSLPLGGADLLRAP